MKLSIVSFILLVLLVAGDPPATVAQGVRVLTVHQKGQPPALPPWTEPITITFPSTLMRRNLSYRVILPVDYTAAGSKQKRYPVVYLLHGLWGHFDNWTDKTRVAEYSGRYDFIIITPEGGDGWYTDSPVIPNDKWESYVVDELIPEVEGRFRAQPDRAHRIVAGLSMGGYGAIKFGLKYPQMFSLVGSFSGCMNCATWTEANGKIGKTVTDTLGPAGGEVRRANDVVQLTKNLSTDQIKTLPFVYFSCGADDQFYEDNHNFEALLTTKKVPHEYRSTPGTHSWQFWDEQVREFLAVADRLTKR